MCTPRGKWPGDPEEWAIVVTPKKEKGNMLFMSKIKTVAVSILLVGSLAFGAEAKGLRSTAVRKGPLKDLPSKSKRWVTTHG